MNALFLVTVSVRVLAWVVTGSIASWDGTVNEKSGIVITVPEYTAARISSPGRYRSPMAEMMIPDELPSMIATWSSGLGGVVTGGKSGPG